MYLSILLSYNPVAVCQFTFVESIKWRTKTILTKVVTREIYAVVILTQEINTWLIETFNLKDHMCQLKLTDIRRGVGKEENIGLSTCS